jgi:nucleotide-binding universal stress UspA family protein
MVQVQRILFPVDFSETSGRIVPTVSMMREKLDAQLHLLFVARAFDHFRGIYVPNISIETLDEQLAEGARRRMAEFKEQFFKGVPDVRVSVIKGDISDRILDYTEAEGIDMIIMGTHGRKGLDRAFFGSIAERVIKLSPVPVLVVNPNRAKAHP